MSCVKTEITPDQLGVKLLVSRSGGVSVDIMPKPLGVALKACRKKMGCTLKACAKSTNPRMSAECCQLGVEFKAKLVCSVSTAEQPYLEIEPTVLWVYPNLENTNGVFSNTNWNIQ